jgi:hypothetical protein
MKKPNLLLVAQFADGRRVKLGATAQWLVACYRARLNQRNVFIGKSRTQRIEHTSSDDVPIFGLCGCHKLLPQSPRCF